MMSIWEKFGLCMFILGAVAFASHVDVSDMDVFLQWVISVGYVIFLTAGIFKKEK